MSWILQNFAREKWKTATESEKSPDNLWEPEKSLTAADRNKIVRCRPKPSFYAGHFPSLTMREVIYF